MEADASEKAFSTAVPFGPAPLLLSECFEVGDEAARFPVWQRVGRGVVGETPGGLGLEVDNLDIPIAPTLGILDREGNHVAVGSPTWTFIWLACRLIVETAESEAIQLGCIEQAGKLRPFLMVRDHGESTPIG